MYDPIIRIIDKYNNNIKPAKGFSDKCSDVAYPGYYHYVNRTQECVPQCGSDILYEKEDKKFAEVSTSFEKYLIVAVKILSGLDRGVGEPVPAGDQLRAGDLPAGPLGAALPRALRRLPQPLLLPAQPRLPPPHRARRRGRQLHDHRVRRKQNSESTEYHHVNDV